MWLTLHFPDLCWDTCIYTYTPPVAPAYPSLNACVVKHNTLQGCGEKTIDVIIHHTIQSMNKNNGLLVYDNCYAISCHY